MNQLIEFSRMALSSALKLFSGAALSAAPSLVLAQANLRVTASTSNEVVTQTRPAVVTFTAVNDGPSVASSVTATNLFPFPGANLSLTVLGGCPLVLSGSPASPTLTWAIGDLLANQSASCSVELRALPSSANQNFGFAMRAQSPTPDPFPSNNAAQVIVSVSPIDVVSDLSIDVVVQPAARPLPTDGSGRIFVTVRNQGPDAATFSRVNSDYYPVPFQNPAPFVIFGVAGDPCQTFIDTEFGSSIVSTGPAAGLAAGASITCVLGIERRAEATNVTYNLAWVVALGGFGNLDPATSNNVANVVLGISDPPVPVPSASTPGLALLLLCLVLVATHVVRSSRGEAIMRSEDIAH